MMHTQLGKISRASFGLGGYQDAMVGLSLTFSGKGWGVCDFIGAWSLERSESTKWTEEERLTDIGKAGMKLAEMLTKIGKRDVSELVGTPVQVTFEREYGGKLVSWRLLDEVL